MLYYQKRFLLKGKRMNKQKIIAFLLIMIMSLSLVTSASASTSEIVWDGGDYEITVPDDMLIFTPQTAPDDPNWVLAGIGEPTEVLQVYTDMNAKANFVSKGGDINILLTQKSSEASGAIYNMSEASQEDRQKVLDKMTQTGNEGIEVESGWLEHGEPPFFWINIHGKNEESELSERLYGTMINGYTVVFDTYVVGAAIPQETLDIVESMVSSFRITHSISKEEARAEAQRQLIPTIIIFSVIVLLIIVIVVYSVVKSKRDKKNRKIAADKMSAYRNANSGRSEPIGAARFINETDMTFPIIRRFAMYHSYIKNLPQIALGVILSIAMIVMTVIYATEWWMILIAIGIVGYFAYKMIMSSANVQRVQKDIYTRGNKSVAKYSFHESEFSVSGVLAPKIYPYFQITDVRTFEGYIYLYHDADNAYILEKNAFTLGNADEFLRFIKKRREGR